MTRVLTVATWNIFGGRTWDGSRVDLDLAVTVLRRLDADLVAVQKVDRALQRHLDERGGPGADATLRPRARRIVSGPASDHRAVVVELEWR